MLEKHKAVLQPGSRLVEEGILEPVEHSEWATPIVAVLKPDKKIVRICGDFKQTVNPVANLDQYPIPKIEDLFSTLSGGKLFMKLELSQAYLQVPLNENSKKLLVINTRKGLFRYTRLPYGVASAPGIFQRLMENVLQGIPKVVVYIDDILVTGATDKEHIQTLSQVLKDWRLQGLKSKNPSARSWHPLSRTWAIALIRRDSTRCRRRSELCRRHHPLETSLN